MKKFLSILITVVVILSFTTTSALASSESKTVSLVSVSYQESGIVLIFETSGLTKADLKDRSFYADSDYQPMTCSFVNDTDRVRCVVAKKLAGKGEFIVTLAGFGFWGELPEARELTTQSDNSCPGQMSIYHLDATCTHGINISYNFTVPPEMSRTDFLQQILDLWAFFGDPLTVNSVTFVGCQP